MGSAQSNHKEETNLSSNQQSSHNNNQHILTTIATFLNPNDSELSTSSFQTQHKKHLHQLFINLQTLNNHDERTCGLIQQTLHQELQARQRTYLAQIAYAASSTSEKDGYLYISEKQKQTLSIIAHSIRLDNQRVRKEKLKLSNKENSRKRARPIYNSLMQIIRCENEELKKCHEIQIYANKIKCVTSERDENGDKIGTPSFLNIDYSAPTVPYVTGQGMFEDYMYELDLETEGYQVVYDSFSSSSILFTMLEESLSNERNESMELSATRTVVKIVQRYLRLHAQHNMSTNIHSFVTSSPLLQRTFTYLSTSLSNLLTSLSSPISTSPSQSPSSKAILSSQDETKAETKESSTNNDSVEIIALVDQVLAALLGLAWMNGSTTLLLKISKILLVNNIEVNRKDLDEKDQHEPTIEQIIKYPNALKLLQENIRDAAAIDRNMPSIVTSGTPELMQGNWMISKRVQLLDPTVAAAAAEGMAEATEAMLGTHSTVAPPGGNLVDLGSCLRREQNHN